MKRKSATHPARTLAAHPAAGADELPGLPPGACSYACLVSGSQRAARGRDAPELANSLLLLVAVIRLPRVVSDLLVSVNAPSFIHPSSSAAQQADAAGQQPGAAAGAAALLAGVTRSLVVRDWGLFGG